MVLKLGSRCRRKACLSVGGASTDPQFDFHQITHPQIANNEDVNLVQIRFSFWLVNVRGRFPIG